VNGLKRPVLRYPGGKWQSAGWIIGNFPPHKAYVEVFGGGGSVLMRKPRSGTEVYNDIDDQVVNVFRIMRDEKLARKLKKQLQLTPFSASEYEFSFENTDDQDPIEIARRMIFRSFCGVGSDGVFRKSGFRRRYKNQECAANNRWETYFDCMPFFTERLRDVVIENLDWERLIRIYDGPDVLFYCDPPYLDSVCASGVKYDHPFSEEDHERLAAQLNNIEGNAVISGYESELYQKLFKGWHIEKHTARAGIGQMRMEVLWIKKPGYRLF
jgi:DNA adenine methylase